MAAVSLEIRSDGHPHAYAERECFERLPRPEQNASRPDVGPPPHDRPHPQNEWFQSLPRPEQKTSRPIQRFPKELRPDGEDKECYEPRAISIGPYHRKNKHLKPMRKFKALWASDYILFKRSTFGDLFGRVERVAAEARKCYAEDATLQMSDLEFTRMMFLDGCFVLQFIFRRVKLGICTTYVWQDLLLLENQLPFKILVALEGPEGYNNLIEKMTNFVNDAWDTPEEPETHSFRCPQPIHRLLHSLRDLLVDPNDNMCNRQPGTHSLFPEPIHLLHFLRAYLLVNPNDINMAAPEPKTHFSWCPQPIRHLFDSLRAYLQVNPTENTGNADEDMGNERWYTYRSVKELNRAGIDFRVSRSHRFSDVRFRSRKMWRSELELPPILVYGGTKTILLNLVAYEMCYADQLREIPDVTSYVSFLDNLIDRPEDVMELRSKGILKNFTGSDETVAHLFNTITHNFVPYQQAYTDVNLQIEAHLKRRIKIMLLKWIDTYFEAPWSFTSVVAAAIALALTSTQTYLAAWPSGNSQNCTCIASSMP